MVIAHPTVVSGIFDVRITYTTMLKWQKRVYRRQWERRLRDLCPVPNYPNRQKQEWKKQELELL